MDNEPKHQRQFLKKFFNDFHFSNQFNLIAPKQKEKKTSENSIDFTEPKLVQWQSNCFSNVLFTFTCLVINKITITQLRMLTASNKCNC